VAVEADFFVVTNVDYFILGNDSFVLQAQQQGQIFYYGKWELLLFPDWKLPFKLFGTRLSAALHQVQIANDINHRRAHCLHLQEPQG
jgi:hypothetical protein